MCGRFAQFSPKDILNAQFEIDALTCTVTPSYNIAPTREVLALIHHGELRLGTLRWGLLPFWMKDQGNKTGIINARSETLSEKPVFRQALLKRRCLILADGYYEWAKEGKRSLPYFVYLPTKEPFGFAGLWESWSDADGGKHSSCAIITRESEGELRAIHTRMPVILNRDGRGIWLNSDIRDGALLQDALMEKGLVNFDFHRVSERVNAVSFDGPECIEKIA